MRWLAVKTREPDTSSLGWLADCWTTWGTCSTHSTAQAFIAHTSTHAHYTPYTQARMHTTHMHTYTHAHRNTYTPTHMHTCTPTHLHTCTHCTLHTCTHMHTLYTTHMHTLYTLYTIHGTYIHIMKDVAGACVVYSHSAATSRTRPLHSLVQQRLPIGLATPVHIRSPSHTSAPYAAHVTCTAQPAASTAVPRVRIHQTYPDVGIYNSLRISAQNIPRKLSPDLWGDEAAPLPE